jgi:hypothetical protein
MDDLEFFEDLAAVTEHAAETLERLNAVVARRLERLREDVEDAWEAFLDGHPELSDAT